MRLLAGFIGACVLLAVLAIGGIVVSFRHVQSAESSAASQSATSLKLPAKNQQPEAPAVSPSSSAPSAPTTQPAAPFAPPAIAGTELTPAEDEDTKPEPSNSTGEPESSQVHWARDPDQLAARERLRLAREALLADPFSEAALDDGIAAAKALGRWLIAAQLLERKCEMSPEALPPRVELAAALMRLSRWIEAIQPLMFVVEREPESIEAWHNLALCNQALGQLDEALRAWNRVIALAPSNIEALRRRAEVLLDLEQWRKAADDLQLVMRTAPATREDRLNLSLALARLNQISEAREILEAGLASDADWVPGMNRLARLLIDEAAERQDGGAVLRGQARDWCDRSLKQIPSQPEIVELRDSIAKP